MMMMISLKLIGINKKVIAFTKKAMTYGRIRTRLHAENELIETEDIKIQCGIFQGDYHHCYFAFV
jgi:hypothetical protein